MIRRCCLLLILTISAIGAAQSQDKSVADRVATQLTALCREDTAAYTLGYANDPEARFDAKEVMKWTNPVRDGQIGVVSIWLRDGRAQALSSVFANPDGNGRFTILHEFQSLATQPITARMRNEIEWRPKSRGVTFRPIPDAPEPADSPAARLRQMRTVVRDFTAHSISSQDTRWELRMLPQPLFRYTTSGRDTLDGALFTFVSTAGTDPELLLLIEARKSGKGWAWEYAPARFSDHSLFLEFGAKEVWRFINEGRSFRFAAGVEDPYRLFDDRQISDSSLKEAAP